MQRNDNTHLQRDHPWSRRLSETESQRHHSQEWEAASRWQWGSVAGHHPGSPGELKHKATFISPTSDIFKKGKKNEVHSFSPLTFSLVFLSTEPASLVATHLKSPLWLADTLLITREPSLVTDRSGWSVWISRPFLNQRTFGGGEPGSTAKSV